jgi:hypothetical protein
VLTYDFALQKIRPKNPEGVPLKATVVIEAEPYAQMLYLVGSTDKEIAWHGTVTKDPETATYTVSSVELFPQTVSGASVTTDQQEYQKWLLEEVPDEKFAALRFHGHSHVNMGVTPSGTDTNYEADLLENLPQDGFYIFLIMNKRTETYVEIYDKDIGTYYGNSDIEIKTGFDALKAEVAKRVKPSVPVTHSSSYVPYNTVEVGGFRGGGSSWYAPPCDAGQTTAKGEKGNAKGGKGSTKGGKSQSKSAYKYVPILADQKGVKEYTPSASLYLGADDDEIYNMWR